MTAPQTAVGPSQREPKRIGRLGGPLVKRNRSLRLLALAALLLLLLPPGSRATSPTPAPSPSSSPSVSPSASPSASPPPPLTAPPDSPTILWVSWVVNRIGAVDPVDGTFDLDGFLLLSWVDNRLAGQNFSISTAIAAFGTPQLAFFAPFLDFTNQEFQLLNNAPAWECYYGAPQFVGDPAIVAAYPQYGIRNAADAANNLTWVNLYGRVAATYFAPFDLSNFPFDRQSLPFVFEPRDWPGSSLRLRGAPGGLDVVVQPALFVPGFNLISSSSYEVLRYYPAYGLSYSHFVASVNVARNVNYYLNKSISNVIILVIMSLLAALLRPSETNRAAIQITTFMGIVSWVFVLSNDSPKSQTTTKMDIFINSSFAAIFVLYCYYSTTFVLKEMETKAKQRRRSDAAVHEQSRLPSHSLLQKISHSLFGPAQPDMAAATAKANADFAAQAALESASEASSSGRALFGDVDEDNGSEIDAGSIAGSVGAGVGVGSASADIAAPRRSSRSVMRAMKVPVGRSATSSRATSSQSLVVSAPPPPPPPPPPGPEKTRAGSLGPAPHTGAPGMGAWSHVVVNPMVSGGAGAGGSAWSGANAAPQLQDEPALPATLSARECCVRGLRLLLCYSIKSSIRVRDLAVTGIVLAAYVIALCVILQPAAQVVLPV